MNLCTELQGIEQYEVACVGAGGDTKLYSYLGSELSV